MQIILPTFYFLKESWYVFVIKGKLVNNKVILTDKFKVSYYEELHYKNKPEGGDCKEVKSELEIYINSGMTI